MDRNPNDGLGGKSFGEGSTGGSGFGASGAGAGTSNVGTGSPGVSGGSTGGFGSQGSSGSGLADRAESKAEDLKDKAHNAQDKAREGWSDAKDKAREGWEKTHDKAGEWKMSLADKLEEGARRLRREKSSIADVGPDGSGVARQADERLEGVANSVAGGMDSSARWLREHDLEGVKSDVERQVRENPARSLLIALGVGYIVGKAFRR